MRGRRILLFFIMIAVGLGLGLLYGWVINPVKYEDTTPSMLHSDYKADYVLMVAEIYHADQNLDQAARRLALLDNLPPARIVAAAALTARERGYAAQDQQLIDQLALALSASSTVTPVSAAATPPSGGKP